MFAANSGKQMTRIAQIVLTFATALSSLCAQPGSAQNSIAYVASRGIRNYIEHGGIGILVYDLDDGYKFVRRIPTWEVPAGAKIENVKGIAASAKTPGVCHKSQSNGRDRCSKRKACLG